MNPSVVFPSLLLLLLFFHTISSSPIEDICGSIQDSYIDYDNCIATLKSDPRSQKADANGLGVVAVDLAVASRVEELLEKASDPYARKRAEAVLRIYSDVIPSLKWSAKSIAAAFYPGAAAVIGVAGRAVIAGQGVVELGSVASEYLDLTLLAHAIATHLH